ncbi:MAG: S9 family peptidase, partial [Acidobacteriaceae bacterium]|nr:S9 family peptidase [Acidobacteriaceae bacterium]
SPDGESLAFLSTCTAEDHTQEQIFLWSKNTGDSRQLTHLTGEITSPEWSPDGKTIAFLFVKDATRAAGALDAMKPWAGVIGEDSLEVQSVYGVDVATKDSAWLLPPELQQPTTLLQHVYEFSWSPDSQSLVYVAAPAPGENNWWVAKLMIARVGGILHNDSSFPRNANINVCVYFDGRCYIPGSTILNAAYLSGPLHGLQIAVPRFSPDGKWIAFIGGLMSDQGSTGGDVYVIPSTGGEPKNITPGRRSSVAFIEWINDSILGLAEHVGGSSHLAAIDLNTGSDVNEADIAFPESIGAGGLSMSVSIAQNHDIAIIRSSFERPPEVWAGPVQSLRQITHLNDGLKPAWGKTASIEWINDGFHVQGWLLYPANYDPAKKYPLLVYVHGGPSSALIPHWPGTSFGPAPFSALGYFVFMPNPRGSFGQGEKFTQANIRDFGYGDLRDILAGMDKLEQTLAIDKTREGITGWSYGGFMTMFAVTQTPRFRAAVAGAGISDWKSYYGENSIDQWMIPFFGASVYDDSAIYAKSSAIEFIKKAKTPTLIVVGDRDGECPAPQSFEFWHALRAEGVKTQLVIYPNEGHAFRNPDHRRDVLERAYNWFQEHGLGAGN